MFKWYAAKRVTRGVLTYAIIIFILSALFNAVNEKTMRAQIEEMVWLEASQLIAAQPEAVQRFRVERTESLIQQYHLDRPLPERILHRTWSTLTFDFGKSTIIKSSTGDRDVIKIVGEAIPRSLVLFTLASALNIVVGVALGLKKAQKPGGPLDRGTSFVTMIIYGMPAWWLAMLLIMLLVYTVKLFPSGGMHSVPPPSGILYALDMGWHMVLPILTLLMLGFWSTSFVVRNIVLGVLQEDFIMSARARGLPENVVLFGHTMRTAAPPLMTMAILHLLSSISGAIIFEGIFSWPGLGNLYWIAIQRNDVPVLMGDLAITVGLYQLGLVTLDLVYSFLDPRIKVGGKA